MQAEQGSTVSSTDHAGVIEMVARDFEHNVPVRNNRYHFKVYRNTFIGREAVDYLILAGYAREREEAVELGRELCQGLKLFEHVCRDHEFKDEFLFYRFLDPSLRRHGGGAGGSSSTCHSPSETFSSPVTDWTVEKLTQVADKLRKNVLVKDRNYRLKKFTRCFIASEAVDFLVGTEIVDRRSDAVLLGRRMQSELGAFHHVVYEHIFKDEYLFFRWKIDSKSTANQCQSSRSPEAVLDFWLGSLREPADMNEENWRDRMNQWRVGIYVASQSADSHFRRYQKEWCDATCMGVKVSILDGWENEPYGALAKLIILDRFPRTVYQGTPLAFGKQTQVIALVNMICANNWDEQVYNVVERMWVYMAASQIEDKDMQDLSIANWTKWSTDVLAVSSKENKVVNRKVSLHFLKVAFEHAEAVADFGHFPHRNPILNRPNSHQERQYLLSESRPAWTRTQSVDPEFQALHAIIHQIAPGDSCNELSKDAVVRFDEYFGLDGELIPVLFRGGKKAVTFHELYAHLRQSTKKTTLMEIRHSRGLTETQQQICQIIYQDAITVWPPVFSEVPLVLDVPKLNAFIGCPFLVAPAQTIISRRSISEFQQRSGFQPEPISKLYRKHLKLLSVSRTRRQALPRGEGSAELREEAVLDKDHFRGVIGPMISRNRDITLDQLFDLFDAGDNKVLDSSELFVAMIVFGSGSVFEKARLTVSYFDTDGDNWLSPEDLGNLFEACFLRCPIFIASLFQGDDGCTASARTEDSDDEVGQVTVQNIQTLRKAQDLVESTFTQVDSDKDGFVKLDELVAWLQLDSDSSGSIGTTFKAKNLFLELFRLNDALFFDTLH